MVNKVLRNFEFQNENDDNYKNESVETFQKFLKKIKRELQLRWKELLILLCYVFCYKHIVLHNVLTDIWLHLLNY